jgi:hypothetical protein
MSVAPRLRQLAEAAMRYRASLIQPAPSTGIPTQTKKQAVGRVFRFHYRTSKKINEFRSRPSVEPAAFERQRARALVSGPTGSFRADASIPMTTPAMTTYRRTVLRSANLRRRLSRVAVGAQGGRMENALSRRAGHASISTLDVRTGRLQWRAALHWREHYKIEYALESSLRQVRSGRLGGCHLSAGRPPAY